MLEECTALTTPQSDPWYGCQWHLNNTGQFDGGARQDINVESVWSGGNMGEGINVAVVDDGLEFDHEDLSANVLTARNHDYARQGGVYDPSRPMARPWRASSLLGTTTSAFAAWRPEPRSSATT